MSDYTYQQWADLWSGGDCEHYQAIGYLDGTTFLIWHDGETFFAGSETLVFERLHPLVVEELRSIAREQRNNRRLLEAL